jgi:hypothetical protein
MNVFVDRLRIFAVLSLLLASCSLHTIPAQTEEPPARVSVPYEEMLGKSLMDQVVANFLTSNNCSSAAQFQLCNDIGVALSSDPDQIVETVYFYLNNVEGFAPYKGELWEPWSIS